MLYICIPAYNEAPTIGLVLWKIRRVFQEFPRDFALAVYDDGSTDDTAETLKPYTEVLPLTILGGGERGHLGYGAAVDALCRWATQRTRYARRDAMILMQGDFTDQPEHLPDLVKRFEGGADIVVGEHPIDAKMPREVRQLRRAAGWLLRPFVSVEGVTDPFGTFRLFRISVLRDTIKRLGDGRLVERDGWAGNVELLLKTAPAARRIEVAQLDARYDLRSRGTRVRPWADAVTVFRFGSVARALRASAR